MKIVIKENENQESEKVAEELVHKFRQALALAAAMLPGSRPMEDWEKRHADEFFWSQFTSDSTSQQHGPPAQ